MSILFLDDAARLRREQLLEEAAGVRLVGQSKDAERASHRFFSWIGAVWSARVSQRSHGRSVKGACCA
jgi:hypothetical protein